MKTRQLRGPKSLFRGKIRAPVSITLTPKHHRQVRRAMARLRLSRADLIALLIQEHADDVTDNAHISSHRKPPGKRPRS